VTKLLWTLQILLALAFLAAGSMKLMSSREQLLEQPAMAWASDFSPLEIKLIGAAEVSGALGLVLPAATGIAATLTPLAAGGLAALMAGAVATHLRRGEPWIVPFVLGALALVVVIGRWRLTKAR
jgi:uncharacterized membrane protein YphA (DoxX/SURF4 family)